MKGLRTLSTGNHGPVTDTADSRVPPVHAIVTVPGLEGVKVRQFTITGNEHVAVPPPLLVAVQLTWVVPTLNRLPDGGTHCTAASAPHGVRPVTVNDTAIPSGFVHGTTTLCGHWRIGLETNPEFPGLFWKAEASI